MLTSSSCQSLWSRLGSRASFQRFAHSVEVLDRMQATESENSRSPLRVSTSCATSAHLNQLLVSNSDIDDVRVGSSRARLQTCYHASERLSKDGDLRQASRVPSSRRRSLGSATVYDNLCCFVPEGMLRSCASPRVVRGLLRNKRESALGSC